MTVELMLPKRSSWARAEEADVDAPGLQPVGEDLGHADTTASAVSASSPSPIDSGSRVGFEPMQPDS